MKEEKIIVVDSGCGCAQDVARMVRDCGVYSEIVPYTIDISSITESSPKGVIVAGSICCGNPESKALADGIKNCGISWMSVESTDKLDGIRGFIMDVCGCANLWTAETFIETQVELIKKTVGNDKVLLGLSGGVDSSVVAALVHKAIGKNLTCVFVDTGLMRYNERADIEKVFTEAFDMNLISVDVQSRFLKALEGITDPERKRKIIGELFIRVFEEESAKLGKFKFLAQGTVYPDIIESVNKDGSVAVKSHHNVGGLPEKVDFVLLEPLKSLFKDEVRRVGKLLGLPDEIVYRHPFPGPGLAVRIAGEVTKQRCDLLRLADKIAIEELRNAGLYNEVWQAFCVLLPVMSVGVRNSKRVYEYVAAFRAVNGKDGMSASWSRLPYDVLDKISQRIINEVEGIGRMVYDISSKPPATIEWE